VAVANNNAWYDLVGTREIKSVSFKNILVKGGFQEDSQNETEWHRALAKLLRKRRPILIKNSPVSRWAAIDAWKDGDYFTKQGLKKVEKVRRSSHPVFVYEDNTRMLGKENEEEEGEEDGQRGGEKKKGKRPYGIYGSSTLHKKVSMSTRLFIKKSNVSTGGSTSKSKKFYYYSRKLSESPKLEEIVDRDTGPRAFLDMSPVDYPDAHFWMGGKNITASTHYDRSHNLFVQCVGAKQFILWEPLAWKDLALHPFYHPRDRQSQMVYREHGESIVEPGSAPGRTVQPFGHVTLQPGDLLYIPPFWFHRVTSKSFSVSLNTWSSSPETFMIKSLNNVGLPKLVSQRNGKASVSAAALYIRQVAKLLKESNVINWKLIAANRKKRKASSTGIHAWITSIVKSRYLSMGLSERIPAFQCQFWDHARCPKTHSIEASDIDDIRVFGEKSVHHIMKPMVKLLKVRKNARHVHGAIGLIVGDYIERVSTFAVGPDRVCSFLLCVGSEVAWKSFKKSYETESTEL
jgi:hypothetical protein